MKKRLLAAIMSLCMIVSLMPMSSMAAEDRFGLLDGDQTYNAYFYVVDPNKSTAPTSSRETADFDFIGQGTVSGGIPAASESRVKDQTIGVNNSQARGWKYTAPTTSSSITYQGNNYQYWDGTTDQPTENYYTVHWYRYSSANGYTDKDDISQDVGYCWHVDGYMEFNNMENVQFKVQFPGSAGFVPVTQDGTEGDERSIWYVKSGEYFDSIADTPDMEKTKEYQGVTYTFEGWYKNELCTQEVTSQTAITEDMTFYGKYVPDVPNITVEKEITSVVRNEKEVDSSYNYSNDTVLQVGDRVTWTVTVKNNTGTDIGAHLTDSLKENHPNFVTITPASDQFFNMMPYGKQVFTVTYYGVADEYTDDNLTNTVTVSNSVTSEVYDKATTTNHVVDAEPTEPNLSVTKEVKLWKDSQMTEIEDNQKVDVGDTLQYTVTVTNSGAAADASTVVVTDSKFPENKNNVTVTSSSGAETVAWSGSSATITSELAKGESVTFTYTYPVTEQDQYEGTVSNTASVTFNNVKQDTATRTVSVKAKTYSLTYNANGGTFENGQSTSVVNNLTSGTDYSLGQETNYQKPTHAQENLNGETVNVAFIGWTLSNNNGFIYSANAPNLPQLKDIVTIQSPGVTVYAVWGYDKDGDDTADVLEHTVTFDAQGGTPVPETQYVQDNETATEPTDPTKAGYTFAGWTLNGEPYDFTDPVTSDIDLVAQWTDATRYTVTYNANNGTLIGASSVTVIPGQEVQLESSATRDSYIFMGWTTEPILGQTYGVGASLPETIFQSGESFTPTGNTPLYAVWGEDRNHDGEEDVYEVFIAPADITIYTGGTGYEGVSDGAGNEIENSNSGLPEPGFHIILPADLNMGFGEYLDEMVRFTYKGSDDLAGGAQVTREWTLSYVGIYSDTPRQYVYSLESADGTPPIRVTYRDPVSGAVLEDADIGMTEDAAHGTYTISINHGGLTPTAIQAEITKPDGTTENRSLVIGTGELTIRSTVDNDTTAIVDHEDSVTTGDFTAVGNNASYMVNDSQVPVTTANNRVQLLVDDVSDSTAFNSAMGEAALDHANMSNASYETAYLDLVDTQNGNTVVTLNSGSMDIYWPMPAGADVDGDFQVVHYRDMNRENTVDADNLAAQATEVLTGTPVYTNGDWYVRFNTDSFSPFVLVYEEDTSRPVNPNPGGGSGSGDNDSDPTGNLSIELDVNGGDDEFTFTVILTDKDGDDLENNFYYNGDYTGTIGSGDEITLEGGDKIVIRNLPEGTRYEVIIETADGYTYVIDGEEGVIHTGMNEAEFTATRTVPVADPSVTGVSRWLNTTDHIAYLTGYPGGAFGPDNNMTRAEVAQMFYALLNNKNVTITKTFPDVPADAWYATAVNTLASLGMVSGDEHGNYRPNDPITRAEFCVIALAFAYEPENAVCYFGDVSRSDWFYTYVAQAASYGWIGGYTNGNFGPNDRITRAQVTTIVNNMLGRAADRDYVIDHQADLVQFTDLTRAHWGYFQIMEATNAHDYTKSNGTENWR